MDNDSPEQSPKELAQEEEKKWNDIVSEYGDDDSMNLISSFSVFERTVKRYTNGFQEQSGAVNADDLKGLWGMFMDNRRQVVEAYKYREVNDGEFQRRIKYAGMKHVDNLFHAVNYYDKESPLYTDLEPELGWTESALDKEYGIKTQTPFVGQKPDLNWQNIIAGGGEAVSKVIQPGFIEKDTGRVIREAVVETV